MENVGAVLSALDLITAVDFAALAAVSAALANAAAALATTVCAAVHRNLAVLAAEALAFTEALG